MTAAADTNRRRHKKKKRSEECYWTTSSFSLVTHVGPLRMRPLAPNAEKSRWCLLGVEIQLSSGGVDNDLSQRALKEKRRLKE